MIQVYRHSDVLSTRVPSFSTVYFVAVIFFATLIRSTFGFGEALIAVPLLALVMPVAIAAPVAVLVSVVVAAAIVVEDWRRVDFRSAAGLLATALVGIPVGVLLLAHAPERLVKGGLGLVIVAFSIYSLATRSGARAPHDHPAWLIGCGFLSGVLGGAYGMNGPPLVVYGALRQWPPQKFRATLQAYFLPASLVGVIGYAAIGLWTPTITRFFLWSLPAVAAGIVLGRTIHRRMSADVFLRLVHAALVLIGVTLVVQALKQ